MNLVATASYRKDIDGLRAIAVIAVIIFHFGALPNGYLGVDIFFVISGYLITGIIHRELKQDNFSILQFYIRRTRRILPLSLFIVSVSLLVGLIVMLPDDLENLSQSIIATNFFGNNVLQAVTTKNYWDVVNEFKPLMHTWSLGIEEQYYVIYPLLLLLIGKYYDKWLMPSLIFLTFVSFALYLLPFEEYQKFYFLPFRFFELAIGGVAAIYLNGKVLRHNFSAPLTIILVIALLLDPSILPKMLAVPLIVLVTCLIICSDSSKSRVTSWILQNKLSVAIGLISFSLYMWHQVLLAYARYFVFQKLEIIHYIILFVLIVLLSVFTYFLIEQPFRNKKIVSVKMLLSVLSVLFLVTTISSSYIYVKGGVIRDVPELGIYKQHAKRGIHAIYNAKIYKLDQPFNASDNRKKVLVIGNSQARDWVNVLLESNYSSNLQVSYVYDPFDSVDFDEKAEMADVIFYHAARRKDVIELKIDESKLYVVGMKNFGINTGYFYNYSGEDYFQQRTFMEEGYLKENGRLSEHWGDRYIDLISLLIDENNKMPVFTPGEMFISQDCRHFTQAGAAYYANLLDERLFNIFEAESSK